MENSGVADPPNLGSLTSTMMLPSVSGASAASEAASAVFPIVRKRSAGGFPYRPSYAVFTKKPSHGLSAPLCNEARNTVWTL